MFYISIAICHLNGEKTRRIFENRTEKRIFGFGREAITNRR
jgi:hypothetical protein